MPAHLLRSFKLSNVNSYNLSLLRLWSRVLVSPTSNIDRVPGLRALQDASPAAKHITIAVIDGPADLSHPAFQGADLSEVSEGVRPSRHVDASRLHGTHVASVLFGQSGGPVAGIVPACRGLLIPVFADAGDGNISPCSEIEMARAILTALRHGANVINISAGRMSGTGTAGMHLSDAIRLCAQSGVIVVAAAGNDGCDCHQVPAALPEVLAVGAMDGRGDPVGFSNWGAAYRKGGVLAPGTDILGAEAGGGAIAMSGTSFATPIVAGVAALLMAKQIEAGGKPDGRAVLAAIVDGADACDLALRGNCDRHLAGALNIGSALRQLAGDAPAASRAPAAFRSRLPGLGQRSAIMDEQHGDVSTVPEGDASHTSIETLAASLKAMEGMMGELSRTLGSLRPSGIAQAAPAQSAPPARGQKRSRCHNDPTWCFARLAGAPCFGRAQRATASSSCPPHVAMPARRGRPGSWSSRSARSVTILGQRRAWTRSRAR